MLTRFTGTAENKAALVTQVPLGRLGLSEEVADGIVFLGSDEGRFITGHVLNVDGGSVAQGRFQRTLQRQEGMGKGAAIGAWR